MNFRIQLDQFESRDTKKLLKNVQLVDPLFSLFRGEVSYVLNSIGSLSLPVAIDIDIVSYNYWYLIYILGLTAFESHFIYKL